MPLFQLYLYRFMLFCYLLAPFYGSAEQQSLHEQILDLEKNELHLHIGGAWPLSYLQEIAQPEQFTDLCQMLDRIEAGGVDYHGCFAAFQLIAKIVRSDEQVENGVATLCKDLWQDHVVYAELRTGLKDLGSGLEGHLCAVLRGIQRGTEGTSLKAGLILSLRRDTSAAIAKQTVDLALKYRDQGVVGIDVSGDSTQGDGSQIFSALINAKENLLPITLHIGETNEETAEQQMLELTTLEPRRIGHGVYLCEEAKNWVLEHNTLVELCLTSALKTGMISEMQEHPALNLLMQGHPVALCTDDPLIFKTTLSKEYSLAASLTGLTLQEIQNLQIQNEDHHFSRN